MRPDGRCHALGVPRLDHRCLSGPAASRANPMAPGLRWREGGWQVAAAGSPLRAQLWALSHMSLLHGIPSSGAIALDEHGARRVLAPALCTTSQQEPPVRHRRVVVAHNVVDDLFHVLWVHGVGSDLCGSVLVALCGSGDWFPGRAPLPAGGPPQLAGGGPPGGAACGDLGEASLLGDMEEEHIAEDVAAGEEHVAEDVAAVCGQRFRHATRNELQDRLRRAWMDFRRWARGSALDTSMEVWTCKRLGCNVATDVPQLGGKGADQRLVLLWLHTWLSHMPEATRRSAAAALRPLDLDLICRVVHLLAFFVHKVSTCDVILPAETQASLRRCTDHFTKFYLALAEQAVEVHSTLFKVRPKLHGFWEMGERLGPLSPNATSCMLDEAYMGVVSRICAATHRVTMTRRVLDRYLHMLDSVLQDARQVAEGGAGVNAEPVSTSS